MWVWLNCLMLIIVLNLNCVIWTMSPCWSYSLPLSKIIYLKAEPCHWLVSCKILTYKSWGSLEPCSNDLWHPTPPTGHPMASKSEYKRADTHSDHEGPKQWKSGGGRESLDRTLEVARAARNLNVINNARRGEKREAVIHLWLWRERTLPPSGAAVIHYL